MGSEFKLASWQLCTSGVVCVFVCVCASVMRWDSRVPHGARLPWGPSQSLVCGFIFVSWEKKKKNSQHVVFVQNKTFVFSTKVELRCYVLWAQADVWPLCIICVVMSAPTPQCWCGRSVEKMDKVHQIASNITSRCLFFHLQLLYVAIVSTQCCPSPQFVTT